MTARFRLTLEAPREGQDKFFLWTLIILPIIAESAYIFEAWFFVGRFAKEHNYHGLISTVLIVFTYLRYAVPIESRRGISIFYIILYSLNLIGTIGYLLIYIEHHELINVFVYIGWALVETLMTAALIYYRAYQSCSPTFHLETKHLFQFISRLEIILAIFIPFFIQNVSVTLTKHSIAFFLLFDFFSEYYSRFQGAWIKSCLYFFVGFATVSVACEWIYSAEKNVIFETIAAIFELFSAILCNLLIIFQFIPFHFRPTTIADIARQGILIQRAKSQAHETLEIPEDFFSGQDFSKDCTVAVRF